MKSQQKVSNGLFAIWLIFSLLAIPNSVPVAAHQPAQATNFGQISGSVTSDDGIPLVRPRINAYTDLDGNGQWEDFRGTNTEDDSSLYTLTELPPGRYRVGFAEDTHYPQYYDNAATVETATDVFVVAGETTPNINAELVRMGQIRGHVTDNRGEPLESITVVAYHDQEGDVGWEWAEWDMTERDGGYTIEGLELGTYRVGFMAHDNYIIDEFYDDAPTVEAATDIFVDKRDTVYGIDATLDGPTGRIIGRVVDDENLPIEGADIHIYNDFDQDGVWKAEKVVDTAADGTYVVAGLPDGLYRVGFSDIIRRYKLCPYVNHATQYYNHADTLDAADTVIIAAGNIVSGIDAQLHEPNYIQGRVTDLLGNPIPNVWIVASGEHELVSCLSTRPEQDGRYSLAVNTDTYRVLFHDSFMATVNLTWEYYNDAASEEAATPIIVPPRATITDIDAQIAPPGTIRGHVINSDAQGITQIRVTAYRDFTGNGRWQPVSSTVTDASGYYGIPGVGDYDEHDYHGVPYRVGFTDLRTPPLYHPEFFTDAGYPETGADVRIADYMEVYGIDALLSAYGTVNFAPLARPDLLPVLQLTTDGPWASFGSVLANDADTEATPLHAELIQAPSLGSFTLNDNGSFVYTPDSEPWVSETFAYRAFDGINFSEVVSVTFFLTTDLQFLPIVRYGE